MANEGKAVRRALRALVHTIPTEVATQILAIAADAGLTLPAIAKTEARMDLNGLSALPHLAFFVEGSVDAEDWMTAHTDLVIPLTAVITFHKGDDPATADEYAWEYCRALSIALEEAAPRAVDAGSNASGIWYCGIESTAIDIPHDDRNRRRAIVAATLKLRTMRGKA